MELTPLRIFRVWFFWEVSVSSAIQEGSVRGRNATRELEPGVADELAVCEQKIEAALDTAWHALRQIHDDKLYKVAGYKSFESYCEKRWGYSKTHAYRLIDYSKLIDHLKAEGVATLPQGEGVARPLMKLKRISKNEDDFMQRATEAWQIATDTAPKTFDVPNVTVDHVESSMQHYGVYRNAKRKNPDEDADEIQAALAKVTQCAAFKGAPAKFYEKHGRKGQPAKFYELVTWLNTYAELCGGETD